ncbi:MAG: hypothetical protein Q9226_009231, partial [Calogaya cf. arnoldii]
MPPATKNRRTDGVAANNKTTSALSKQQGIQAFGKVSKSQSGRPPAGKSKAKTTEEIQSIVPTSCVPEQLSGSKKRKAQDDQENFNTQDVRQKRIRSSTEVNSVPNVQLQPSIAKEISQPRTPRKRTLFKSISIETPTKGARSYLETLDLSSPPNSERDSTRSASRADTPASSPPPESDRESSPELAEELQDLIDLHSCFLTALTLHYAHH